MNTVRLLFRNRTRKLIAEMYCYSQEKQMLFFGFDTIEQLENSLLRIEKGLLKTIIMITIKSLVLIVCLAGFYSCAQAQTDNPSDVRKNNFSVNILGTGSYLGVSYERLLYERVSAEIGIGVIGFVFGATFYFLKWLRAKQLNPFIGIKYTNHSMVNVESKSASYLPIGITYFIRNGLSFSIDSGPSYFIYKSPGHMPTKREPNKYPYSDFGVWGNLKLGFRF